MTKIKKHIENILKADQRLWYEEERQDGSKTNELNQTLLIDLAEGYDEKVLSLLFADETLKEKFFVKVGENYVFKSNDFQFFLEENKVDNSYTKYKNRIGLSDGKRFLKDSKDVVLNFPFKDGILEGGQSSEEGQDKHYKNVGKGYEPVHSKRKEIFFNEIIAHDEIQRLRDEKALVNWKRFDGNNDNNHDDNVETEHCSVPTDTKINRDQNGTIKENLIIKGNNYLALHSLKKQFAGKVKLIYIDPPYNTGNDGFKYNDNFNHSTWLTFMKNRLEVAKQLLRDDGVIFVQCDDNEQAYLKVLMDEVFGRENFITNFLWEKTQHFGRQKLNYYSNAEYIITYGKNIKIDENLKQLLIEKYITDFDDAPLYNASNPEKILSIPKNKCQFKIADGEYNLGTDDKYVLLDKVKVKNGINQNTFRIKFKSRWTDKTLKREIEQGGIVLIKSDKFSPRIIYNQDKNSFVSPKQILFTNENNPLCANILNFKVGTTSTGSNENEKLFNTKLFEYPKPESLIGYLIEISTQKGDIALDYHLGSGTTAAVAHKMGRQYIGIEQMDYIEPIAVERLKKVIAGEQGGISKAVKWQGGGSFIYCELAKWNEKAKEKINTRENLEELKEFFKEMVEKYFLNYNLKIKEFREKVLQEKEFINLPLQEQKKMFITMLDLDQMYVSRSEMEDGKFGISEKDVNLTKLFYGNI